MKEKQLGSNVIQAYQKGSPILKVYLQLNRIESIGLTRGRDGVGWEVWELSLCYGQGVGLPQKWYQRKCDAVTYALELCSKTGLPLQEF